MDPVIITNPLYMGPVNPAYIGWTIDILAFVILVVMVASFAGAFNRWIDGPKMAKKTDCCGCNCK